MKRTILAILLVVIISFAFTTDKASAGGKLNFTAANVCGNVWKVTTESEGMFILHFWSDRMDLRLTAKIYGQEYFFQDADQLEVIGQSGDKLQVGRISGACPAYKAAVITTCTGANRLHYWIFTNENPYPLEEQELSLHDGIQSSVGKGLVDPGPFFSGSLGIPTQLVLTGPDGWVKQVAFFADGVCPKGIGES